jgi:hypothetical protein
MKISSFRSPLFLPILLLISTQPLHAQTAPSAGTTVAVKMLDTVDSGSDPAGKQYRASVTKGVDAGNGITIAQGAAATITLKSSGSGYTAQLSSITINGQPVTVTSNSATVSASAQLAQSKAANAVGSVLGGFGHHVSAPVSVAAAATGQHISLPTGTTLTFVLGESPAMSPATPAPSAAQPTAYAASAAPDPSATAAPSSGPATWYRCNVRGSTASRLVVYATPYIHTDATQTTLEQAWFKYMRLTYPIDKLAGLAAQCEQFGESADQRAYAMTYEDKGWTGSNADLTHVDWTYTPTEVAATNVAAASADAAIPTAAPNEKYVYCISGGGGPVVYYSDIFAGAPTSPTVGPHAGRNGFPEFSGPFVAFLQEKYGYKENSNSPTTCRAIYNPVPAGFHVAQTTKQAAEDLARQNKTQVVETGWKNAP